jgi:hypothetical protein
VALASKAPKHKETVDILIMKTILPVRPVARRLIGYGSQP